MTRVDSDEIAGKHRYTTVMARIGGAPTTVDAAPVRDTEPDVDTGRTDAGRTDTGRTDTGRTDTGRTDIVVLLHPAPEPAEPSVDDHPTEEVAGRALERVPEWDPEQAAGELAGPTPRRRRWLVAAAAAAVVAALVGAVVIISGAATGSSGAGTDAVARPIPPAADPAPPRAAVFGETVRLVDGWTVRVDRPAALRDEEYAELPAGTDRAVRLLVTVRNDAEEARDSAGWSVKATADSRPVELIAADGYAGAEAPSRTLLPGAALTLAVAVPMPVESADLQVEAARAGRPPAIFVGQA